MQLRTQYNYIISAYLFQYTIYNIIYYSTFKIPIIQMNSKTSLRVDKTSHFLSLDYNLIPFSQNTSHYLKIRK